MKPVETTMMRNIFIEGPDDKYHRAKAMIDDIIRVQKQNTNPAVQISISESNPFVNAASRDKVMKIDVPDKYIGLIIGKGGDNIKGIAMKSNTKIFIPQKDNLNPLLQFKPHMKGDPTLKRTVEVVGS
mmetsp:Transcript_18793/g.32117  ORF Transcript_18793/g.32117 Transcript_18793/m.32117 type:complete len:128 (-) Transcript_18793:1002-1385(-)